jgi:L-aspartate oxidase
MASPQPHWPSFSSHRLDLAPPRAGEAFSRRQLQHLMSGSAGVVRDDAGLELAAKQLAAFAPSGSSIEELETANLLLAARLLVQAARARRETRGAHCRSDFPHSLADPTPRRTAYSSAPVPEGSSS